MDWWEGSERGAEMNALREAAQRLLQVIDAALPYAPHRGEFDVVADFADDLRAALAEPVQEPVAWRYKKQDGGWFVSDNEPQYVEQWNDIEEIQPLYTAPPQRPAEPVQEPAWVCPDSAEHRYQKPGHCEDCGKTLRYWIGGQDE